jgi:hypothetical protein
MNRFTAWAIKTNDPEHSKDSLIGRYWWFDEFPHKITQHLEGCLIALFTTRKIARENLKHVKMAYPKAQVVPVKITVEIK